MYLASTDVDEEMFWALKYLCTTIALEGQMTLEVIRNLQSTNFFI